MKSIFATILTILSFSSITLGQETKVYLKSNEELGRFYAYVDGELINRAPQIQVGITGLDEKPSYKIRVVFQNPEKMPIESEIKPKKNRTRLFVLYAGTDNEVQSRKANKKLKERPIPGDNAASHPAMPNYKGRLGCDYPAADELVNQIISFMTSNRPQTPYEIALREIKKT